MILQAGIFVLVQYYNDKSKERQSEIDYCLTQNLNNIHVKKLINFCENGVNIPDFFLNHHKFINIPCSSRLTFKMAIDYANENLKGKFCCLCNSDIFLDESSNWGTIPSFVTDKTVLALSRYEFGGTQKHYKDPALDHLAHANTQDAWIFKPPLFLSNHNFCLGSIGCDNAIADRIHKADVIPINNCNRFKVIHYDLCRKKTIGNYTEFHKQNDTQGINVRPELQGYRLLPDIDRFTKIDDVCEFFAMSTNEKYSVICDIFNSKIVLKNRYD
tara:strand:+ start:1359 stop:2174 length:816 start_codon:yes stop_codon:yes gene_type:complete